MSACALEPLPEKGHDSILGFFRVEGKLRVSLPHRRSWFDFVVPGFLSHRFGSTELLASD